jgi:ribosome-associated protein
MAKTATKKITKPKAASKSKTAPKRVTVKKTGTIAAPKRPRKATPPPESEIRQAAMKAAQYALEKKATDIHVLDLMGITTMTDFFVIATGSSDRQVKAIAENVVTEMRDKEGVTAWKSEGWDSLQWIIIDFVDFVVHVFQEEFRKYYNIERLWADAPTTEVKEEEPKPKAVKSKRITKPKAKDSEPVIKVVSGFKRVSRKSTESTDLS